MLQPRCSRPRFPTMVNQLQDVPLVPAAVSAAIVLWISAAQTGQLLTCRQERIQLPAIQNLACEPIPWTADLISVSRARVRCDDVRVGSQEDGSGGTDHAGLSRYLRDGYKTAR